MKIIRKGILPKDIIYTGMCSFCGCMLECTAEEVQTQNLGDRYSGAFITHNIKCPTEGCQRIINVTQKT